MYKPHFFYLFLGLSIAVFAQKKAVQKFESSATSLEILTTGIDHLVIKNSTSGFVEIYLLAENAHQQHILINENYGNIEIAFQIPEIPKEIPVFRKFITQRLERATAIIKIPNAKKCTVFGDDVDVTSRSYKGPLNLYLQKGILKLNKVQTTTNVKIHTGSVFAAVKDMNIAVSSKKGIVSVDKKISKEQHYQQKANSDQELSIITTKGNIYLTTLKPQ